MRCENVKITVLFHWSKGVWAITIACLLGLIVAAFILGQSSAPWWLECLLAVILLSVVVIVLGYMPIRLCADGENVTLTRLFGPLEIPLRSVEEIKSIPYSYIDNSIRTFGSGGLFGYIGRFKNSRLGHYRMYATELKNLLLIRTDDNKRYVFSCVRSEEFVAYVNSKLS